MLKIIGKLINFKKYTNFELINFYNIMLENHRKINKFYNNF